MEFNFAAYDESDGNYAAGASAGNENEDPRIVEVQPDAYAKQGDALLVTLVESYPILYDKTLSDHKNMNMRECCWMQIGSIMVLPAGDCAKRWAQLRESFCREKRKRTEESRSGSGSSKRKGFLLFEDMQFLEDHVAKRKTFSNVAPAARFLTNRTPMVSLPVDENVQASQQYILSQSNMPRISTNNSLATSSPRFPLAISNPSPRLYTPPPTPTPPLDIGTETCSSQTPTTTSPLCIPTPPSLLSSVSSSFGPMSPLLIYPPAIDRSSPTNYSESNSQPGNRNTSRTTLTSQMPVENDMDPRLFPRPQSSSSWRNDSIFKQSPSPPCKLGKLNACYNKELSKPKKIDPIESSFINLSSAIQDHFTNPIRREIGEKSVSSTDADDIFGSLIANELKKLDEPGRTAKKARLLQVMYEKE